MVLNTVLDISVNRERIHFPQDLFTVP